MKTGVYNPLGYLMGAKGKKKRGTLTLKEREYLWEHREKYDLICHICGKKINKQSDLELDHIRAFSRSEGNLALAHRRCNKMKSSGSLRKLQKMLGLPITIKENRGIKQKTAKKSSR